MATFPDLYVMRWMSCFLEHVFPRNRLIARAFSRVIYEPRCLRHRAKQVLNIVDSDNNH